MRFFTILILILSTFFRVYCNDENRSVRRLESIPYKLSFKKSGSENLILIPNREIRSVSFNSFQQFRSFDDIEESIEVNSLDDNMFIDDLSFNESMNVDSVQYHIEQAHKLAKEVEQEGRFIDYLSLGQAFQLPVGVRKTISELEYTVIFHKVILDEGSAFIDAYLTIKLPSEKMLSFMGRGIEFSNDGGITGVGRVELLGNNNIAFSENSEEQKILLTLIGGSPTNPGNTYAEFDCYGFRDLSLDARITFSKDFLLKENEDGSISNDRLTSRFATKVTDWNNLIADITLPKFQVNGLKDWSFRVTNAVIDFSDTQNAGNVIFPTDYESPYFQEGNRTLWRGFYLREIEVTLPEEFNKKNQSARTSFFAGNLIIDETGMTGTVGVRKLIDLNEGDADSWKLSVESLSGSFIQNKFVGGDIAGQIEVPSLETEEPLLYAGSFSSNGDYSLIAELQSTAKFNVFKADLNLEPNSLIELKVLNGKFKPRAVLHGNMDVKPTTSSGKKGAEVNGLIFQSLVLQTEAPYFDAEYFGFKPELDGNKAGGFPIGIEEIALRIEGERVGIYAGIIVNLVRANDSGFGAGAGVTVWAKQIRTNNRVRYEYDKLDLSKISVDVSRSGFSFYGELIFYEGDNTYGNGFKGYLNATFADIGVEATGLFGNVDGYRYWYVDAMMTLPKGIPVIAPFAVNGIGGGAFYQMRQQGLNENIGSEIGRSASGIVYIPDDTYHLGIKASVQYSLMEAETAANGEAEFSIAFNSNGGVNQVAFNGSLNMMTASFSTDIGQISELASKVSNQEAILSVPGSSLRGNVNILFDSKNKTFHGVVDVFVNTPGGIVKGINAGGLAGRATLHFEPNYWYIHIGKPDHPIGLEFLNLAQTESYFMIGHDIPGIPSPPQLVLDILTAEQRADNERIRSNSRGLSQFSSGKGFAFGSSFTIETGDRNFLMFYGRFAATAGFDINMQRLNASCYGRSGLVGINGWYAEGQAYFGMLATIGMKVNLRFIKKNVEIFHGELAALMQVKGPNPFWMQGDAAGRFSVLNGLVEGNFDFTVTIGEECELEQLDGGNPLQDVSVIAQLTPDSGSSEVDVFTSPQAVFNIPVEKEFTLTDQNENILKYIVELEYFELKQGGKELDSELEFNADHDVLVLRPIDILPDEKDLKLNIKIRFKEYKDGEWKYVEENGSAMTEQLSISFKSGQQPDYIPEHMVEYTYPIKGMVNFYQNETNTGYIKLNQGGLTRPFETEGKWNLKVSFTDNGGKTHRNSFSYNSSSKQVVFDMPTVPNNEILNFQLLRVPKTENASIDSNVKSNKTSVDQANTGKGINFEVETQSAEGTIEALSEEEIYGFFIRSSEFNTLEEKFNSPDYYVYPRSGVSKFVRPYVYYLYFDFVNGKEMFQDEEIYGQDSYIEFNFVPEGNVWFEQDVEPLFYDHTNQFQPITDAFFYNHYTHSNSISQTSEFSQNVFSEYSDFGIRFNIPDVMESDYRYFKSLVADNYTNSSRPQWVKDVLNSHFPVIRTGNHKTKVKYRLPNGQYGKSQFVFQFLRK
ncbi:hypothetical protein QYS49_34325 [Marivirga salinae]|uniref:Uncharacterized protein n=1 Tax=Marivirga salinarum TaxID=3059078 RepID=A0AA51NCE0_9BACT|nr:hypothetical protein [Marivirga sp. BDSF4-3]WMN12694.1 hypothetical protein QYS49_34325 [Marivirga sp. BDSF4-3]